MHAVTVTAAACRLISERYTNAAARRQFEKDLSVMLLNRVLDRETVSANCCVGQSEAPAAPSLLKIVK